jgi:hypothetical protein
VRFHYSYFKPFNDLRFDTIHACTMTKETTGSHIKACVELVSSIFKIGVAADSSLESISERSVIHSDERKGVPHGGEFSFLLKIQ